jgi:hypothetical protein
MFRFSVRWLLAATGLCCFCLAALNYPSEGMLVFVGLVLSASMLVAIAAAAAGRRRAFAAAYAGGLLVALAFSDHQLAITRLLTEPVVKHAAVIFLGPKESAPQPVDASAYERDLRSAFRNTNIVVPRIDTFRLWRFHTIVCALLAGAFGAAAGSLSQCLTKRATEIAQRQPGSPSTRANYGSWRTLAVVGAVACLAALALRVGSDPWLVVVAVITIGVLFAVSVRAAAFGRLAPFSLGFALAGWAYFALGILAFGSSEAGLRLPTEVITSFALAQALDLSLEPSLVELSQYRIYYAASAPSEFWFYLMNLHIMALLLWSLVMGLVGGMATVVLVERDARRNTSRGSEAFTTPHAE